MDFDISKTMDALGDGVKNTAEAAHEKTESFHENYVSKITPDMGKYGDAATFAAEMVPGVAEYNAVREGDWTNFAISAGIDVAAIAVGAFSAGAGYAALKGGSTAAKAGVKVAVKEVAEAGTKKAVKEAAEAGTKKAVKEVAEAGAEKAAKEVAEAGVEKVAKETGEVTAKRAALEVGEAIDKTKFPEYIKEIGKITKREIPTNQKELLEAALKEKDFVKLSPEANFESGLEFARKRSAIIKDWEVNTGKTWPTYAKDVLNDAGNVIRNSGAPYDAHHIIEKSVGGPHEWWNMHPAAFPNEHQGGIHALESLANQIFK